MRAKKIFVTGAGGFIGSHLVERLVTDGNRVKAFLHYNSENSLGNLKFLDAKILKEVEIVYGDVSDPFSLEKQMRGNEVVFHLAALIGIPYSYLAPQSYVQTNIMGTLNVLEACKKNSVEKMVHTSTSETYGTALFTPIHEEHPLQGQSPYSATKIGADKIVESYFLSFETPVVTVRPFNTYGPRQSSRAVIPTIVSQALFQKDRKVKVGYLDAIRDFNYVTDTVDGFVRLSMSKEASGKVINIGSGQAHKIKDVIEILNTKLGLKFEVQTETSRLRPEGSEVHELLCDYSKAQKYCGYKPSVSFELGLSKVVEFVKNNPEFYPINRYQV